MKQSSLLLKRSKIDIQHAEKTDYCILGTNVGGQNIPSKFILNHDEAKGKKA